jgi:hypothetical protein
LMTTALPAARAETTGWNVSCTEREDCKIAFHLNSSRPMVPLPSKVHPLVFHYYSRVKMPQSIRYVDVSLCVWCDFLERMLNWHPG